ncbi:lmo0937 family membrane protein [Sphingobacterium sp. HMA12]|uniref:lmo0937 family membrane protein n=1 Tax=Sphingobacterium sp. HMA12 TaxID=2050894 RepID=UPI000CEA5159|nr:lmo0937 family membrane protein [Sphingobacterium sp. HMA12]
MRDLLYIVTVLLVLIWAISFLGGFVTGEVIHILLAAAIITTLLRAVKVLDQV